MTEPFQDIVRIGLSDLSDEARPVDVRHLADVALRRATRPRGARIGMGMAAAATAAILAIVVATIGTGDRVRPSDSRSVAEPTDAHVVLEKAALAALSTPTNRYRPDQYFYEKSVSVYGESASADYGVPPTMTTHTIESWYSFDGHAPGIVRTTTTAGTVSDPTDVPVAYLFKDWSLALSGNVIKPSEQLPFDRVPAEPGRLLAYVQKFEADFGIQPGAPQLEAAYQDLGRLFTDPRAPAELHAAAFRAIALIPGVSVVHNVKDVAGRSGIAVALPRSDLPNTVTMQILDPDTYRYLGDSLVAVTPHQEIASAKLVSGEAILATGVTDAAGQVPPTGS